MQALAKLDDALDHLFEGQTLGGVFGGSQGLKTQPQRYLLAVEHVYPFAKRTGGGLGGIENAAQLGGDMDGQHLAGALAEPALIDIFKSATGWGGGGGERFHGWKLLVKIFARDALAINYAFTIYHQDGGDDGDLLGRSQLERHVRGAVGNDGNVHLKAPGWDTAWQSGQYCAGQAVWPGPG